MNLYEIRFIEHSQKDNQEYSNEGILTYLAANSNEEVHEWLKSSPKSNPKLEDNSCIYLTTYGWNPIWQDVNLDVLQQIKDYGISIYKAN